MTYDLYGLYFKCHKVPICGCNKIIDWTNVVRIVILHWSVLGVFPIVHGNLHISNREVNYGKGKSCRHVSRECLLHGTHIEWLTHWVGPCSHLHPHSLLHGQPSSHPYSLCLHHRHGLPRCDHLAGKYTNCVGRNITLS